MRCCVSNIVRRPLCGSFKRCCRVPFIGDGLVLLLNSYDKPIGADDSFRPVEFNAPGLATASVSMLLHPVYGALDGMPDCFFSDANAPWLSRSDAEEYVSRIEECKHS